jgi:iron complex transport system substrate-binding protein
MAPSLTETAFALGLGDAVVGVTRFCDTPPCARSRTSVGGYLDPSYETVVGLEPDLVLLMQDHAEVERRLRSLGIRTVRVDQSRVPGILRSFEEIAAAAGVRPRGVTLAAAVRRRLDAVARDHTEPRPRVLVVVGREMGAGTVTSVWVAGPDTFYQDVVTLAGGDNAWTDRVAVYPEITRETLLALDPDIILDVVTADAESRGVDVAAARADWDDLGRLHAVRTGRVYVLDQGWMVIPGPRVARAVETVADLLARPPASGGAVG